MWRFREATLRIEGLRRPVTGASMSGTPATSRGGVTAEVVFVGDGRRSRLDRLDVQGKIALVDWTHAGPWLNEIGLELGLRGARAIIVCCLDNGKCWLGEGALGTMDSRWHGGAPPVMTVRQRDGRALIKRCRAGAVRATMTVVIETRKRGRGRNVCGVLGADRPGAPIVVGAHHDGWFFGAFDNASGVATMLSIARGLTQAGWQPRRPVWFVSHTAEEYGVVDADQQWCVGAWHQVAVEHRAWGSTVPFYLDIEASGRSEFPQMILGPTELRRFANGWARRAEAAGLIKPGWKVAAPSTGTHQWPFQLAGVPGLSVLNWDTGFERADYHTDQDTLRRLDFEYLSRQASLYAAMLVDAEARGASILDFRARARDVAKLPYGAQVSGAAQGYALAGSRRRFARLGRGGFTVDAGGDVGYLPVQADRDAKLLGEAIRALDAGDPLAAARLCEKVGVNHLQRWVSREVQVRAERRHGAPTGSWPDKSRLSVTPNLWREIATLRGQRGARRDGPWLRASLERARVKSEAEAARRVRALGKALGASPGAT
jgi:hypothetical protein